MAVSQNQCWVQMHIPRKIQSPRPLLPLLGGRHNCVRRRQGEALFALSPLTSNWESIPLVPVTLLEKPASTSELKENPKRRTAVQRHPLPGLNSPRVLSPQRCRLHLGQLEARAVR